MRILIVDDEQPARERLGQLLGELEGYEAVGEAANGKDAVALAAELQPAVVQFHWALPPKDWVDRLHAAGVDVWHQVGTVTDAQRAVDLGVDGIIAQGLELSLIHI